MSKVGLGQLDVFYISLLWGAGIGILYDVFRCVRKIVKHNVVVTAIEDIVFWLICAWLVFYMLYRFNQGSIRFYIVMGMLFGAFVYRCSISELLVEGFAFIIGKIMIFFTVIGKYPWLFLKKFIKNVHKLLKNAARTIKLVIKNK